MTDRFFHNFYFGVFPLMYILVMLTTAGTGVGVWFYIAFGCYFVVTMTYALAASERAGVN